MADLRQPVTDLPAARFIGLTVPEVIALAEDGLGSDGAGFRRLAEMAGALLHSGYRSRWQQVSDLSPSDGEPFVAHLRSLLDAANFDEVPRATLERALVEASVFKVRLHVEFDHFAELLLFRRSQEHKTQELPTLFGLRHRTVEFVEYGRVAMYARYQDEAWFTERGIDVEALPFTPGTGFAKLFSDVPEADLEMLVPGTEVRMRTLDKLAFGVPAVVGGVVVAVTKLAASLLLLVGFGAFAIGLKPQAPDLLDAGALITLLGGLVAFASFLWRQWTKFKNRRIAFLKRLSENLYGKTLADGPGVLFTVLDAAESEDLKETVLAYRGLLEGPLSADALDARVEALLEQPCRGRVDFEVSDGVRKLALLGLATEIDGSWHALPVDEGLTVLRERWRELGDALLDG